ncbi:MAG: hypothetical protein IJS45_00175 [Clostridia bacterium]|nr:hypothetical protein [Clostridia bacterium]
MTVIVCFDTGRGMTFFGKRQSADRAVIKRILSVSDGKTIYAEPYAAPLFRECGAKIVPTGDFSSLPGDAVCFAETVDPASLAGAIDKFVIYRWNRKYPRDCAAGFFPYDEGLSLYSISDFTGNSHDRITEEIWVKYAEAEV